MDCPHLYLEAESHTLKSWRKVSINHEPFPFLGCPPRRGSAWWRPGVCAGRAGRPQEVQDHSPHTQKRPGEQFAMQARQCRVPGVPVEWADGETRGSSPWVMAKLISLSKADHLITHPLRHQGESRFERNFQSCNPKERNIFRCFFFQYRIYPTVEGDEYPQ